MSALDPVVSARPAYLPTGPREEYRGERPVYRRDVGPRGSAAPGGAQASIPSRPTITAVKTDQIRAESREPVPALSAEPSTSQKAIAVQPTTPTSTNPATHLPLAGLTVGAGEPPQDIGEEYNGGEKPRVADFNPGTLAHLPKKQQIVEAVRQGHGSYAEISVATYLTKSEVSAVIHATLLLATKSRPAVLVESTPPGAKERRFEIANEDARLSPSQDGETAPALLYGATTDATPFRFKHVGDMGHTAMVGPTCSGKSLAVFTEGSQKDRILAAVAHGAHTTTEITHSTGLLREQVHKAVGWLVKKGELQDMPSDEERTVELAPSPGTPSVHPPVHQDRPAGEPAPAAAKTAPTQGSGSQWNDPIGKVLNVLLSNDTVSLTALCAMTGLTRDEGLQAIDALDVSLLEMKGDDEFIERFHGDDDEIWYQYMTATMDPAPQMSLAPALRAQNPTPATDEFIDQLEAAATEALKVLRDTFSRLADLARENAVARDRLTAVQRLLGGEG